MTNAPKILYGNFSKQIHYLRTNHIISSPLAVTTQQELNEQINQLSTKQNILYLRLEKDKSKISIEQIQRLIDFGQQKPHLSSNSVVIVDDAQTISEQAQNKLLKLLEEPPSYLYIFFLLNNKASIETFLKTVLSRCQLIDLRNKSDNDTKDELDSELIHLTKQFFSTGSEIKLAYLKAKDLLKQAKSPNEGKQILASLINHCSHYNKQLLSELTNPRSTKPQSIMQSELQTIDYRDKLFSEMASALKANVNKKLILNRLFIELIDL